MSDYIDRRAALDAIEKLILPQKKGETAAEEINRVAWRCAINCAEEMIGHLQSADVEPVRHGRWIFGHTLGHSWMKCSECLVSQSGQTACFSYCPNCGAIMDGERKEDVSN